MPSSTTASFTSAGVTGAPVVGTEIVTSADGSMAGLLGASPGASTAAPIMLSVLQKVFKDKLATPEWQQKVRQIVPSYGTKLNDHPDQVAKEWAYTSEVLQLAPPPVIAPKATGKDAVKGSMEKPKANASADMAL